MAVLQFITSLIALPLQYVYPLLVAFVISQTSLIALAVIYRLKTEFYNENNKFAPSKDKAILITGATSGIGLALTKYFYRKGFTIIVAFYSDEEPGYNELQELSANDKSMFFVKLNVRSIESIKQSHELVKDYLQNNNCQLHALINNAGIAPKHPIVWDKMENTVAVVETNLLGPALMCRQYVPLLAKSPHSRIVNLASVLASCPTKYTEVYGATKAGVAYLSQAARNDLINYNIKSVCIEPGNLINNTAIMAGANKDLERHFDELDVDEKALFRKDYDELIRRLGRLNAMIEKFRARAEGCKQTGARKHRGLIKFIRHSSYNVMSKFLGSIDGANLEDTSFMISFDNAICLKDPPTMLYAGNRFYTIVVGAILDTSNRLFIASVCSLIEKFDML